MPLRSLKQYIESFSLSGINELFTDSKEFKLNIKVNNHSPEFDSQIFPANNFNELTNNLIDYKITDLNLLKKKYSHCKNCDFHHNRIKFVYGEGSSTADCLIISNPPDSDENLTGRPFMGRNGQLFNKMIQAVNINREEIYLTNICKCRPDKNFNPQILNKCLDYLNQQIYVIKPKIILIFGSIAANCFLNLNYEMEQLRIKNPFSFDKIPVFVTYHPESLHNNNNLKKLAWLDLQKFRDSYQNLRKEV